jgi:hypothetical protein
MGSTRRASSRSSLLAEPGIEVRCLDVLGAIGLFSLLIHLNYHGRLPLIDVTMPVGLSGGIFNPGAPASADEIGSGASRDGDDDEDYDSRGYDAGARGEDGDDQEEDEDARDAAPTPSRRRTSSTPRKRRQF